MKSISDLNTIRSCIYGLAVADALGVPVEFSSRASLDLNPVTGVRGYGTYGMPAGSWSDDTSMTLCAMEALARQDFRWEWVMDNFSRWLRHGDFTPTGYAFDSGGICRRAVANYEYRHDVTTCGEDDDDSCGNGSLMRILPFALYAPKNIGVIETASALTHAHPRCKLACVIYCFVLDALLRTGSKSAVAEALQEVKALCGTSLEWKRFEPLLHIGQRERETISGGGYVVDTLEAALWALLTTDSYRDCVLAAINLGSDTDTIAAVAGGLAGALYGFEAIPADWVEALLNKELIDDLCAKLSAALS